MKVILNQNFEFWKASTKISNGINSIIEENEDDIYKEIKKKIDSISERGKLNSVKNYIKTKKEVKKFFHLNKGNSRLKDIGNN